MPEEVYHTAMVPRSVRRFFVMDRVIILLEVTVLLFIFPCSMPIDASTLKGGWSLESVS